jgi:antitoxin (DNA-binding transcriptional repressor) of toxin-antitoxin stability system
VLVAKPRTGASRPSPSTRLNAPEVIEVKAGVFKDTCLQLLDQVSQREVELAVTKRGTIVARVVPPDLRAQSAFGFMRGTVLSWQDIIAPDHDAWGDLG